MPTLLNMHPAAEELPRGEDLLSSDGVPMETGWHVKAMWLLIASIEQHWLGRTDFYVGGNQFFYFDPKQARNTKFQGPDFYLVKNISREPIRKSWVVWEEDGRVPNVIIELLSPSTADNDRTYKKKVYLQDLDVKEYFCYEPEEGTLEGWRKNGRRKPTPIPLQGGRIWSEEVELFLGPWEGAFLRDDQTWLRFYHPDGRLSLIADEVAAQQATAEAQRATAEAQRADTAEAELAKLRAELERLRNGPKS